MLINQLDVDCWLLHLGGMCLRLNSNQARKSNFRVSLTTGPSAVYIATCLRRRHVEEGYVIAISLWATYFVLKYLISSHNLAD